MNIIKYFLIGALTSKPYAFTARSWELRSVETIDFFDSFASNVRVDTRGSEVMRVLPKINNSLNEEWISDKIRFSYDGFKKQRLYLPLLRTIDTNKLSSSNWRVVFNKLKELFLKNYNFVFILGDFVDLETQLLVKLLSNKMGAKVYNQLSAFTNVDFRTNYLTNLQNLDNSDCIFLVGLNLRLEFPVLNIKVRKRYLDGAFIVSFGYNIEYNYGFLNLGSNIKDLKLIVEGKHLFCRKLVSFKNPLVLVGSSFQVRKDALYFFNFFFFFKNFVKNVYFMQNSLTIINGYELGLYQQNISANKEHTVYYIINADNIDVSIKTSNNFVVYQGHIGDRIVNIADAVLPGSNPIEKNGSFFNINGDLYTAKFILAPFGDSRVDWKILKALADVLGFSFNFNKTLDIHNTLKKHLVIENSTKNFRIGLFNESKLYNVFGSSLIENFYLTDSISRASSIMALSSKRFFKNYNFII